MSQDRRKCDIRMVIADNGLESGRVIRLNERRYCSECDSQRSEHWFRVAASSARPPPVYRLTCIILVIQRRYRRRRRRRNRHDVRMSKPYACCRRGSIGIVNVNLASQGPRYFEKEATGGHCWNTCRRRPCMMTTSQLSFVDAWSTVPFHL